MGSHLFQLRPSIYRPPRTPDERLTLPLRPELTGARTLLLLEEPMLRDDDPLLRLGDALKLRLGALRWTEGALFTLRDGAETRGEGVEILRLGAGLTDRVGGV